MPSLSSKVFNVSSTVLGLALSTLFASSLIGCQPKESSDNMTSVDESEVHEHKANHDHINGDSAHHNHMHEEDEEEHHDEHMHDNHEHNEPMDHEEHTHEGHTHEGHHHEGHSHDINRIQFTCSPDKHIGAFYHTDASPKTAHLLIDGIEYDFTQIKNDDEQVFVSQYGLDMTDDTHGMMWQVHDNEAVLSVISADNATTGGSELNPQQTLFTCHKDT